MILDRLENAEMYFGLHPGFGKAFQFLRRADLGKLPVARHPIDSDRVYALTQEGNGKDEREAALEAHKNYIDIQFLIDGDERIGWKAHEDCAVISRSYDEGKDIEFFSDVPLTYVTLKPGMFAIFFPGDAHAPMISKGHVHKCVVKVRLA
jgi:biofilm protein TabA